MFSDSNLKRWTSSISAAAIAVVGVLGSISSPASAQPATCTRRVEGTTPLTGIPANVLAFARRNTPTGVTLTRTADIERTATTTIYELRGYRSNGCSVEVDVIARGAALTLDEVEEQLPSVTQLPQVVRNTLASRARGFRATLIERNSRPAGVVIYELEGTLNGQGREIDINSNGTLISIQAAS